MMHVVGHSKESQRTVRI